MSGGDRAWWDARHGDAGPSGTAPPGALVGAAELTAFLPVSGRALDVACGRGGVAVWLAQRGLVVDAVDISPVGLAAGARLAAAAGVTGRVRWITHDLDAGLPADCRGPYDVVVCQRFRDPHRYSELAAALAPGGVLAITVLSEVDAGPGPFRAPAGELRTAFSDLETLLDREHDGEATLLARRLPPSPSPAPPGSPPAPRPRS